MILHSSPLPASASAERRLCFELVYHHTVTYALVFDVFTGCSKKRSPDSTVYVHTVTGLCSQFNIVRVYGHQCAKANRVTYTWAHHHWRIPHLVSEPLVKRCEERQRPVWAGRLDISLGSSQAQVNAKTCCRRERQQSALPNGG